MAVDIVIVNATTTEVVTSSVPEVLVVSNLTTEVVTQGIQGPPGPAGGTVIGGAAVVTGTLSAGDQLEFIGSSWVNVPKTGLTDGGNF